MALDHLATLWNSTISTLIASASKKKQTIPRNKRIKENSAVKYLNIPIAVRNLTLETHFSQCKRKLVEDCHTYIEMRRNGEESTVFPKLRYVPTEEEIVRMVEKTVESINQPSE